MGLKLRSQNKSLYTRLLLFLASLTVVTLVACGSDAPSESPDTTPTVSQSETAEPTTDTTGSNPDEGQYGGVLDFAYFRAPTSPDGYQSNGGYENFFIWSNNEPVIAMDTGGGYDQEASLTSSYEVLDEGLRIRLHLREGVQFQGGLGEMTASDVAWSLNRWFGEGATGCPGCAGLFAAVTEVTAVDPTTVDIVTDSLDANIIVKLMGREAIIHSQAHWDAIGQDAHKSNPIGTGPYMLTDWQVGTNIKYVRHDDWWQGRPYADEVNILTITETRTRLAALQTGQVNVAFLQSEMIPAARQEPKIDVWAGGYGIEGWRWNPALAPLDDIRVRRALLMAIDRDALNTSVYLDTMDINSSCILAPGPLAADCSDLWETDWFGYDVDAAKALIEDYAADTGKALPLQMRGAVERRPDRQQLNEFLQGSWRDIGVEYTFITTANVSESAAEMEDCDIHHMSTGSGIVAQRLIEGAYHSRTDGAVFRMCAEQGKASLSPADQVVQDEVDSLLDQASQTVDEQTRIDLYKQVAHMVTKNAFMTFPLMNRQNFFGCNNTITGGCGNEDEGININRGEGFFRQSDFWVKQ